MCQHRSLSTPVQFTRDTGQMIVDLKHDPAEADLWLAFLMWIVGLPEVQS